MPQFEQVEVFSSLIFWSLLSFGLLFVLLKKYAFPPILDALDDREKKIRADIEGAEKLKQCDRSYGRPGTGTQERS